MCNPNSSIASRRYRTVAMPSGSASLLTQKLMGTFMGKSNTNSSSVRNDVFGATSKISGYDIPTNNNNHEMMNEPAFSFAAPAASSSNYHQQYDQSRFQQPTSFKLSVDDDRESQAASAPKKPKRRRKPQKPGLTAKNQERHFVHHDYHDHANDHDEEDSDDGSHRRRGGVAVSFPLKLHSVLEQVEVDGFADVISWQPHGRCFVIHKPKEFTDTVMPRYFRQSKLTSFQRQLNLYGFQRLTRGNDSGGYYHELFLRGKSGLCKRMLRTKVKGTKFKAASSPEEEPNFYTMSPVVVTPHSSDCEHSEDGSAGRSYHQDATAYPTATHHTMMDTRGEFYPPYPHYEHFHGNSISAPAQPQEAPVSPMVNNFAMQTFGIAPPASSSALAMAPQFPPPSPIAPNMRPTGDFAGAAGMPGAVSGEFLDQAVDELFLEDPQAASEVMDFVSVWDGDFEENVGEVSNDFQLGNLLDKLLED